MRRPVRQTAMDSKMDMNKNIGGCTVIDPRLRDALARVASHYGCSSCVLALREGKRMTVVAVCNEGHLVSKQDVPLVDEDTFQLFHHHLRRPVPTILYDAADDKRVQNEPCVNGELHVRFYAAAPIYSSTMECNGTLCIVDTAPKACFSLKEADYLCEQAKTVAGMLQLDAVH
eukprot:TRINITY_DN10605_c1_g1_i3.p1 TRINITY_DN10605_c1_g1~~TRINITY_DN10605_c1_g1_i3.p1  ORF type:complete len:173 (+),score=22.83 TRINITY_DN10605_c1_g1_i3:59-577(+)